MYINDSLRLGVYYTLREGFEWTAAERFNFVLSEQRYNVLCDIIYQLRLTKTHRAALVEKLVLLAAQHNVVLPPESGECWAVPKVSPTCSGEQIKCL